MKRITVLLCTLVLLLMCITVYASASEITGTCGDNLTWLFDESTATLTISGTGDMTDYYVSSPAPWANFQVETAVVNPGVTSIGDYAFYNEWEGSLKHITIPDSVTRIGNCVFTNCKSLDNVTIPYGVTSIGRFAFNNCTSLSSITIPSSVKSILWNVFSNCDSLTSVTIPSSIGSIPLAMFEFCDNLESVVIEQGITTIGTESFRHCTKLKNVTIPKGVVEIQVDAFSFCKSLTKIDLPNGLTQIGGGAFEDCSGLVEVVIPKGVITIGGYAFGSCYGLTSVVIPDSVTSIGLGAFRFCESLTSVTIPGSVRTMGRDAFSGCLKLETLVFEDGVTEIGEYAFQGCTALKSVTIPDSVTTMEPYAFQNCTNLETVEFGKGLATIPDYAFNSCSSLKNLKFSRGLKQIKNQAFAKCTALEEVLFPDGLEYIGYKAFFRCDDLEKIILPCTVETIGEAAFLVSGHVDDVYYSGSKADRKNIRFDRSNGINTTATWHYNVLSKPEATVTANTTSGKPKVRWESVSGAEKYRVYRATSKSGTYTLVKTTTKIGYTDTTAKVGKTYYYKVKAVDTDGGTTSSYSNIVNRMCDLPKPVVKMSVNTSTGKPKLSWGKISDAVKYQVYRATSKAGTYKLVKTTSATSYTDTAAKAGTNYYYKVVAVHSKSSANSAYSDVVNRVCDLAKPTVSIKLNSGDPKVTWKKVSGATKYRVYRATSKNGTYKLIKTTTKTGYTDTKAKAGKTYYYKVKAIHSNSAANSAYSSIKYIKAK